MLLAVIDGVGHGKEAALAARVARDVVDSYADEPLVSLLHRCHQWLRGTRGVVMSLAWVETESRVMRWAGVGNVQGVLLRRKWGGRSEENSLLLRAGVVGVQLPSLEAAVLPITPGDTLVLATDGVKATFDRSLADKLPPQSAADHILAEYGDAGDDALVLVGRYRGNG
jgi:serine/threonine protein phosphatase PrpC